MCDSLQNRRARRIPDQEWNTWREKLIRLYVKDDFSRKEIIKVMAEEHNFVINDTQLKHRFGKWNVNKNIPDNDMAVMLYFWREGRAMGKNIRFQYKGHDIEQERIERAYKRRKISLSSPTSTPSYIKAYNLRHSSPQSPFNAILNDQSPAAIEVPTTSFDSVMYTDSGFPYGMDSTHVTAKLKDTVMVDTFDVPSIDSIEVDERHFQSRELRYTHGNPEVGQLSNGHSSWISPAQIPRSSSVQSEWWQELISFPRSTHSPTEASKRTLSPAHRSLSKSPTVRNDNNLCRQNLTRNRTGQQADSLGGILSSDCDAEVQSNLFFVLEDVDPEALVLPLQLMKSHLTKYFGFPTSSWRYSSNFSDWFIHHFVRDGWFELEFESLVRWSCESYANTGRKASVRKARYDPLDKEIDESSNIQRSSSQINRAPKNSRSVHKLKVRRKGYCVSVSRAGVFRATLGTISNQKTNTGTQDDLHVLKLTLMPAENERTRGLCVTFFRAMNESTGPRISPYIKAINVVPNDSEIIRCVSRNDLEGVQRLFERREASPTDVDERGFSLLSYAIYHGYSDVFRLLLQNNADTQQCNFCTNTVDLIWTIWGRHIDFNDHNISLSTDDPLSYLRDFDQCVKMTNTALDYDYDIHNIVPYNPLIPNVLFEVFTETPYAARREKVLKYLLQVGYQYEQHDVREPSLLLCAVRQMAPAIVKCLKILIENGINIHTIDAEGRGALHCALLPTEFFIEESQFISWNDAYNNFPNDRDECMEWCEIEDKKYEEDYDDSNYDLDSLLDISSLDPPWETNYSAGLCISDYQRTSDMNNSSGQFQANSNLRYTDLNDPAVCDRCTTATGSAGDTHCKADEHYNGSETTNDECDEEEDDECNEEEGDEGDDQEDWRQYSIEVLKKRVRFKLLLLLQAGCDPNVVDEDGESPSDYAEWNGLLPQWRWALFNAGYVYDELNNRWMRRI